MPVLAFESLPDLEHQLGRYILTYVRRFVRKRGLVEVAEYVDGPCAESTTS